MKANDYVKEFGEGAVRMCREMNSTGLLLPSFDDSTFIMKSSVPHSEFKKPEVAVENPEIGEENPEIGEENPEVSDQKPEVGISDGRIEWKEVLLKCRAKDYNEPSIRNISAIYGEMTLNRVLGAFDVKKTLNCADSTATEVMRKLREMSTGGQHTF